MVGDKFAVSLSVTNSPTAIASRCVWKLFFPLITGILVCFITSRLFLVTTYPQPPSTLMVFTVKFFSF